MDNAILIEVDAVLLEQLALKVANISWEGKYKMSMWLYLVQNVTLLVQIVRLNIKLNERNEKSFFMGIYLTMFMFKSTN